MKAGNGVARSARTPCHRAQANRIALAVTAITVLPLPLMFRLSRSRALASAYAAARAVHFPRPSTRIEMP
jgi:hypothetical protein